VTEPVRWGILSTARINRLLLAGARKSERVQVAAVASRDGARARAFADEHDLERAHGSYEDLLEDPAVEAVYVPLPNALHVEWTLHALAAGKHVLCEKPLTRHPEEVEEVFDAADRAGRLVMEAFMYRHHPQTRRLKGLVAEGAIGDVRLIRSAFSFMLTRAGDVRLSSALDGGALMDVGCYCVSGARLVAGEPVEVRALRVAGPSGVDVRFAGMLRFPGDVVSHFDCALDLPARSALEVVGSEGRLFIPDPWHCRRPGIELQRGSELRRIDVESADSYQLELENLSAAIRGEQAPLLGRGDALGQARALAALLDADDRAALDRAW
jgi:xylose dehydrogenase (NAD/NADP)